LSDRKVPKNDHARKSAALHAADRLGLSVIIATETDNQSAFYVPPNARDSVALVVSRIQSDLLAAAGGNVPHHVYNAVSTLSWATQRKDRQITTTELAGLLHSFDQAEERLRIAIAHHVDVPFASIALKAIRSMMEYWATPAEDRLHISLECRADMVDWVFIVRNLLHNALLMDDVRGRAARRVIAGIESLRGSMVNR
jgi:hypothetical protein